MRSTHARRPFVILLLVLGLFVGCGVEPEPFEVPDPGSYVASPGELVKLFKTTYETRDAAAFARLLHPQYVMPLQSSASLQYPDLGPAIEHAEAVRIHERMFSGELLADPNQAPIVPVQAIAFHLLQQVGPWVEAEPGATYPGTVRATYDVTLVLDRGAANALLVVQGALQMHVAARDTAISGVPRRHHELRAITDLTYDAKASVPAEKGFETVNLGRLLGLWR